MTSYELMDLYSEMLSEIDQIEPYTEEAIALFQTIKQLSNSIIRPIVVSNLDQATVNLITNVRQQIIDQTTAFAQKFDMLANHSKLIELKKNVSLKSTSPRFIGFEEELAKIEGLVESFEQTTGKIYEFVKTRDFNLLVIMLDSIEKSSKTYLEIVENYKSLTQFAKRLEFDFGPTEMPGYKELSLHFYNSEQDLSQYVRHYKSIVAIYDELDALSLESLGQLKIRKIESGSFFEKLFGAEKLIDIMADLLKRTIDLIFRKYTFEGKMTRKKEIAEFIKVEIDLVQRCKEAGIHVEHLTQEQITKTVTKIAGDVLQLSGQSARVKINDKELSLDQANQEKFIADNRKLLIEDENLTSSST